MIRQLVFVVVATSIAVIFSCVLADPTAAPTPERIIGQILDLCKEKTSFSGEFPELEKADTDSPPPVKEFLKCTLTEAKVIQNGKYSREGTMEFVDRLLANESENEREKTKKVIVDVMDICSANLTEESISAEEVAKLVKCALDRFKHEHDDNNNSTTPASTPRTA